MPTEHTGPIAARSAPVRPYAGLLSNQHTAVTSRLLTVPVMLWLALAGGGSLLAQDSTDPSAAQAAAGTADEDIIELESFQVTATRRPAEQLDVAEAVTVVTADSITRKAPGVLAEALRGQTGTYFQQTTPGQGIPIIRGLKGSEVLHLVDGMRLNNAFFRNAPNQYFGLVDAFAVQRMEVVRGAAPSLHGADAMGGVVQVITAEPEFYTDEWLTEARLYGSFNSVDTSVSSRASLAAGKAGNVLSGGVTWQNFDDRSSGGGETISPTGYRVRAGDAKWRYALNESSELMLSVQILEQPSTPRIDELVGGYGQPEPSSQLYEFRPNRREFLHARYRLDGSGWFERMELHAARQVITDDRLTQDSGSSVRTSEANESTLDGLTVQFNSPWGSNQSVQQELVWGVEYYTDTVRSSRVQLDPDSGATSTPRGRFPDNSRMDSLAAYAANRWQWQRWTFEAGLRYSRFDISLPASAGVPAADLKPDDLTGDIHTVFKLSENARLVANVGRGFRPPNIFDLGTLGARPGNRFNAPNPNLKPESVLSYDLGVKASMAGFDAELFVFYSDYRDKITSVFTGEITPEGRIVVQSENLNKATLYGVESGLRWRSGHRIDAYAVVNYTRGEEQDVATGTTVAADRVPPLNGRIGLVYAPGNGLRLEPWLDFASQQDRLSPRDREDPRINPDGTPGYTTFNLLLSWQASPQMELGLRLENLGGKRFREHGSGIDAPGRNIGFWMDVHF